MISTNNLVIITLIIAGFIFNYWEIKKNTTLLSSIVVHLKELRLSTYPHKHINNEITNKINIEEEKKIINSNNNINKRKEVDDIINYEVNSQDTEQIEREILNYELELAKINKKNIDIISNSNISVNTIEDKINSNNNSILYTHDNIQIFNQSNLNKSTTELSIEVQEYLEEDNESVEVQEYLEEDNESVEDNKSVEDNESVEDNKSVEHNESVEDNKSVEDNESVEDNKSVEHNESVEDNKSVEDNESVEDNKSVEDNESVEDNKSIEDNKSVKTNVKPNTKPSTIADLFKKNPTQTKSIDKPIKKKEKRNKKISLIEVAPNIMDPLMKKYSHSQLKNLCIYNNVSLNKGTKKILITKLLNNNITI